MNKVEMSNEEKLRIYAAYLPCKAFDIIGNQIVDVAGYSHDTGMLEFWAMKDHNDSARKDIIVATDATPHPIY